MQYELTLLEKIISENAAPENHPALTVEALKTALSIEQNRIEASFRHIILSRKKESLIERYIRYHHLVLLRLSTKLEAAEGNSSEHGSLLSNCVEELLQVIEVYTHRYFDPGQEANMLDKMIITLTVKELALMNRLFIDSGVFRYVNKMTLAKFMIHHVVTLQKDVKEELSVKNFYNSLFSSDIKTMDSIISLLNRMQKLLEEWRSTAIKNEMKQRQLKKGKDKPGKDQS